MAEMIDRVALAFIGLRITTPDGAPVDPRDVARAAIEVLREPTEAMMDAGCASHPAEPYHAGTKLSEIIEAEWRAMIDAAM